MINVIKRDGSSEPYDISKIKKSIAFACDGVDVNKMELESRIDHFMKNGIKTRDIQQNIIQHAIQLASPQTPQWLNVAGKAEAMDMWSEFKLIGKTFSEILAYNIKKGEYTSDLNNYYTKEMIDEIGNFIQQDLDLSHSISSLITVRKKYLGKYELNQHMHLVNAMRFAQSEPEESRVQCVKDMYIILAKRKLSLATPFMSQLRKGGNVASCFILAFEDDTNSIFDNIKRVALISKNGGGLGMFFGYIRAKGSSVNGNPGAAGPVTQWIKIVNDTLVAVNQNGKRKGAGSVALPIWHNDILEFLDMQTEHGDPRMKSYDVFPQVTVPDIFMRRDKEQSQWVTFCPFEVKEKLGIDVRGLYCEEFEDAYLKIEQAAVEGKLKVCTIHPNARTIMKIVMRSQFDTGMPYIAFTDELNRMNPNKDDVEAYGIPCVNLCTESTSNVKPDVYAHVCNLASINMGNIDDLEDLARVSRLSTRLLDYGINLTNNPTEISAAHNKRYRTIGIGIMGLHDFLAKNFTNFSNKALIAEIAECIEYNAALESVELAKRFGTFEAFEHSQWKSGKLTEIFGSRSCGKYDWKLLQSQIDMYGIRNSQLTSPAPTTTTSIYQDASASVLPIYSAFFAEDNKNGSIKVSAKYLDINPLGYGKTQTKCTPTEIIDIVSEIQKFTDTAISMELILDHRIEGFSAKVLYDAIRYAYDKKIKSIYYIRHIKNNVKTEDRPSEPDCVACSG